MRRSHFWNTPSHCSLTTKRRITTPTMAYRNAGRPVDAQREKAEIEKLQKPPEGEFTDFLKRLGDKK